MLVEKGISAREGGPASLKAQLWLSVWLSLDTSGDLHTAGRVRLTPTHTHMVPPLAAKLCPVHTGAGPALSEEPRPWPRDSPAVAVLRRSRGGWLSRASSASPTRPAHVRVRRSLPEGPIGAEREGPTWTPGGKPGPPLG